MADVDTALSDFENAWSRWHRAQAALKPHFVAGEVPPDEKLGELEESVEEVEAAKDALTRAVSRARN